MIRSVRDKIKISDGTDKERKVQNKRMEQTKQNVTGGSVQRKNFKEEILLKVGEVWDTG